MLLPAGGWQSGVAGLTAGIDGPQNGTHNVPRYSACRVLMQRTGKLRLCSTQLYLKNSVLLEMSDVLHKAGMAELLVLMIFGKEAASIGLTVDRVVGFKEVRVQMFIHK